MESKVQIGAVYEHYKGHHYLILALAKHSETLEDMVVYQDVLDTHKVWVRPQNMFTEFVEIDGEKISRFKRIL